MKLLHYKIITGKIRVITGLRIGGSAESLEIGGMDNPVIKNPITDEPYIPGSSIKGKIRSILEWKDNKVNINGGVCECGKKDCPICRIFGTSANKGESDRGPTRLIVRDAELLPKLIIREDESKEESIEWKIVGLPVTEDKVENTINRITSHAVPRHMERVLPGYEFKFEMIYKVYDMNDGGKTDEELFDKVLLGLKYLQEDTLGGAGSRGCGKIKFESLKVKDDKGERDINLEEEIKNAYKKV